MNVRGELLQRWLFPVPERDQAYRRFHLKRFWGRWKRGIAIPVPKTMFMGVVGRKLGLFPVSPTIHWKWTTWLRGRGYSDALVWVVVCDNMGDPLPSHP